MKTISSFPRIALMALALGTASATATFAQTTPTTTTPPATSDGTTGFKHHHGVLTADEKAQLKKAHDAALAADPTLKAQADSLKSQFQTLKGQDKSTSKDQWKALRGQWHDYIDKLRTAELKIDPTLSSVFTKLDAAHKHFHHSSTSTAPSTT